MSADRQRREAEGRRAETLAALWLGLKGYRILARRYRAPGGEIDLVAGWPVLGPLRVVCWVEVKQRGRADKFAEAISPGQRRRIEAAADAFLGAHPRLAHAPSRFDAVFVAPRARPRHVKGLWRRGD